MGNYHGATLVLAPSAVVAGRRILTKPTNGKKRSLRSIVLEGLLCSWIVGIQVWYYVYHWQEIKKFFREAFGR